MSRLAQSVLIMLVGGVMIALTASGRFTSYVKPGFGPLLIAGGIVLLVAGVLTLILAIRGDRASDADDASAEPMGASDGTGNGLPDGATRAALAEAAVLTGEQDAHGHVHSSRAPWLIMAPILVLLLAPPALGADAVSRTSGSQAIAGLQPVSAQVVTGDGGYAPNDGSGSEPGSGSGGSGGLVFPNLPNTQNPPLALKATVLRALYDSAGSVTKHSVTVVGFITPAGTGFTDGYSIARIAIFCCAADANALQLHVSGAAPFPANTWVQAVVTAVPGSGTQANNYVPSVKVASIIRVPQPADPYEH
jgi:uncharacterized repeat protein (TIGR03943 family)